MEIKKGNVYKCIKWSGNMYTKGKNYLSVQDNHLIDNFEKNQNMYNLFYKNFELVIKTI